MIKLFGANDTIEQRLINFCGKHKIQWLFKILVQYRKYRFLKWLKKER